MDNELTTLYASFNEFLALRKLEYTESADDSNFLNEIKTNDRYIFTCLDRSYIILPPHSRYLKKTDTLRRLTQSITSDRIELIVPNDAKVPKTTSRIHQYRTFIRNIVKVKYLSCHEILLSPDELTKFYHLSPNLLPKILINDPFCVWLDAKEGDIIKITSPSETAGKCIMYRTVIV